MCATGIQGLAQMPITSLILLKKLFGKIKRKQQVGALRRIRKAVNAEMIQQMFCVNTGRNPNVGFGIEVRA